MVEENGPVRLVAVAAKYSKCLHLDRFSKRHQVSVHFKQIAVHAFLYFKCALNNPIRVILL